MTYTINNKAFKTKQNLTKRFSFILNTQPLNVPLVGEWKKEVLELLTHHRNYNLKVTGDIEKVVVEVGYGRHFQIYMTNGTNIDISYVKAIKDMEPDSDKPKYKSKYKPKCDSFTRISDIKDAFRDEVNEFTYSFKLAQFNGKKYIECPILGVKTSLKTAHTDHIYPLTFDQLLFNFLQEINVSLPDVKIMDVDRIGIKMLVDRDLAKRWVDYHNTKAELRVLHKAANFSQPRAKLDWDYKVN
jgi:hypothetical protein